MKKLSALLFYIIGAFIFVGLNSLLLYWCSGFSQFYIPPLVMLFMVAILFISLVSFKKFNIKRQLKYLIKVYGDKENGKFTIDLKTRDAVGIKDIHRT